MPGIFIAVDEQPRGRNDAEKSVVHPIDRQAVIGSFSDSTYPELLDIERQARGFFAWGLPPRLEHIENWFRMSRGDFVLLGWKGAFRYCARVLGRYQNERAARAIWGEEPPAQELREYLFFLSEPIALGQPYAMLDPYLPAGIGEFTHVDDNIVQRMVADYGSVERCIRRQLLSDAVGGPVLDVSGIVQLSEREMLRLRAFDQDNGKSARQRLIEGIIRRRGQPALRQQLLAAYDFRCAISNSNALDVLEVAYISPYRGRHTHHPSNGLLLRADLHGLFDLGKLAVDTRQMTVLVASDLLDSNYRLLAGRPLRLPQNPELRPDIDALDQHRRLAGL